MLEGFISRDIFGLISVVIGVVAFIPYFISIYRGKTTPHMFSYIIWSITLGIVYIAQVKNGAGSGAWITGFGFLICSFIALLSIKYGEKEITKSDWFFLFSALAIIPIWQMTNNDGLAILLATLIDLIGYAPTFRKTYIKPYSENVTAYVLDGVSYIFSIFALDQMSYTNLLYPLSIFTVSIIFTLMVLWRRRVVS